VASTIDPAISRPAPNGERIITEHDWSIVEKVPGLTGVGQGAGVEPK
jgi:hypothetical protein